MKALVLAAVAWTLSWGVPANAATVYQQLLPAEWTTQTGPGAVCSPCKIGALASQRVYASFALDGPATLDGLEFAVLNNVLGPLGDFSVSIWRDLDKNKDKPFREIMFAAGSYDSVPIGRSFVDVSLPGWTLGKGSYYLSIFGAGEKGAVQWGFDTQGGDDLVFRDDLLFDADTYVGFTLFEQGSPREEQHAYQNGLGAGAGPGAPVPLPGTLGLLALGLGGLSLLRPRARAG
jgi:hypothetical protein